MSHDVIKTVALVETATFSGLARAVVEFGQRAARPAPRAPRVEMTVVTYHRGAEEHPLAIAAREHGLRSYSIAERGRWDLSVLRRLREVVEREQPDLIESNNTKSHFYVALSGIGRRLPWIAWTHGYTSTSLLDRIYTQFDRYSLPRASRIVAVCRAFARDFESRGIPPGRIRVLHSAVKRFEPWPAGQLDALRRELGVEGRAVILAVGRLSAEKGHADLVRAAAALQKLPGAPDFRLVIAGDGVEHSRIQAVARELGIQDCVVMAGFQPNVGLYYSIADVLALPSHTEGSPIACMEAMAAGLPVVATSVGGVPEIVEHGKNGLLVPSRDPQAMAESLLRVLQNPALAASIGAAGRDLVTTRYNPEARDAEIIRIYEDLLDNAHRNAAPDPARLAR